MSMRSFLRRFVATLAIGAIAATTALAAQPAATAPSPNACRGSIDVPLHLELTAPSTALAPGTTTNLEGQIRADVDLANVEITVSAKGNVRLLGPPQIAIGSIQQGMRPFTIPVQYQLPRALDPGLAEVVITVTAQDVASGANYRKVDGIYSVRRQGQFRSSAGAYVTAEINAIQEDLKAGLITEEVAQSQMKAAAAVPGQWDQTPRAPFQLPPEMVAAEGVLKSIQPTTPPNFQGPAANQPVSGNVTFNGNLSWQASDGSIHPYYGASVTVWEIILLVPVPVAFLATDASGNYSTNVFVPPLTTCFVDFVTSNSAVAVSPAIPPVFYGSTSPITFDPGDGSTVTWNFTCANTGTGPACGLHSMLTFEAASVYNRNGNAFLGYIFATWPGSSGAAFYDGAHINMRPLDRFAYDVAYHEYGHYVMDSFNFENNPGGPHNLGDCIANVQSSKDKGVRLAWGEGWPTYWGTTVQRDFGLPSAGIPTVGDATYTDTEAGAFSYSLENDSGSGEDNLGRGEDNELAVQRILWDLVDTNSDNRDAVNYSDQTLLDLFRGTNAENFSQAWALVRGSLSNAQDLAFGAITTDALVGPNPTGPANAALVTPTSNRTFTWTANVGCPSSYSGNAFSLRFYRNNVAKDPVLTIPGLSSTSVMLSDGQVATLSGAGHDIVWAVEGSHTASPASGPYLGDNRRVTVDRPPVAHAGLDQLNVECTSHSGAAVSLDGTTSSDPDGDVLTYTWSAPGVTFNNAHSATPIGQFPKGVTSVTLVVSDGFMTDQDQVTVRVVDTTPPVIACPIDITVECSIHCGPDGGALSSDPMILAFLGAATATDICDAAPTTQALSPPACFPLGTTPVTFQARDADNNHSECVANVRVVDTTPPTITVTLAPDVLWPPNNKLVDIHAFVSVGDVCDADPTFVLTGIMRNCIEKDEAEEDIKKPDIVGADVGTPDLDFQLRAEKCKDEGHVLRDQCEANCFADCVTMCASIADPKEREKCEKECEKDCDKMCKHPDRIYMVYYTVTDGSGNTTMGRDSVRVPHDKKGLAMVAAVPGIGPISLQNAPLKVTVPTQVQTIVTQGGDGDDLVNVGVRDGHATTLVTFDAAKVDPTQIYLGTSLQLVNPIEARLVDATGDGRLDLVLTFSGNFYLQLMTTPEVLDDPITLYYRTTDGVGYEIQGLINTGLTENTPVAARAREPVAPVAAEGAVLPAKTELSGFFPNPMRGQGTVSFSLAREEAVELAVFDLRGARVRTLQSGAMSPGHYNVTWDGRDDAGRAIRGGMYFLHFQAGSYARTVKTVFAQ
ncbi:MAG: hypothetical protein A2V63_06300 [Candidatus Eisenbacteria bacterium RBG_19FT_COMBO_70_11]|nr:MAG: hypothetical protein A2V63_06300 [Candidatus Eisenbacteria bacterium RBG_19FT_COMBO_70_11]